MWNEGAQEWEPTIQPVLERADTQPLYDQLAPRLVWGDARGAAIMRTKNRAFRAAIDASIVEWTRTFNNVFVHAQKTVQVAAGARPEDLSPEQTAAGWVHSGPPIAEQIAERTRLQEQWDAATNGQTALRLLVSRAFDYGGNDEASQRIMKSIELLPIEDPRPKPIPRRPPAPPPFPVPPNYTAPSVVYDDERYQYVVAEDVSFYLAFAEDRCQIHAHAPRAIRHVFQGSCAMHEEALGLVQVPAIYDVGLCMYGCPTCMSRMCCGVNIMSENPFELDRPKDECSHVHAERGARVALRAALREHEAGQVARAPRGRGRALLGGAPARARVLGTTCSGANPAHHAGRNQIAQLFEKHDVDDGPQVTRMADSAAQRKRTRRLAGACTCRTRIRTTEHERLRGAHGCGCVRRRSRRARQGTRARAQQPTRLHVRPPWPGPPQP